MTVFRWLGEYTREIEPHLFDIPLSLNATTFPCFPTSDQVPPICNGVCSIASAFSKWSAAHCVWYRPVGLLFPRLVASSPRILCVRFWVALFILCWFNFPSQVQRCFLAQLATMQMKKEYQTVTFFLPLAFHFVKMARHGPLTPEQHGKNRIHAQVEGTTARTGPISGKQAHTSPPDPPSEYEHIPPKIRPVPSCLRPDPLVLYIMQGRMTPPALRRKEIVWTIWTICTYIGHAHRQIYHQLSGYGIVYGLARRHKCGQQQAGYL
jgi:hypothetical protein